MIVRSTTSLEFNDHENAVRVSYDNDGDPYREGVSLEFRSTREWVRVLLEESEVRRLRDKLTEFLETVQQITKNEEPSTKN